MYCWECECGSGALFGKYIMIAPAVLQGNAVENIISLVRNEEQVFCRRVISLSLVL